MKLHKNSRPYLLLKNLAIGSGVLIISLTNPYGASIVAKTIIKGYFRKKKFERYHFLRDIKNLQDGKMIDFQELKNNEIKITILQNGKKIILQYQIDKMELKIPKQWDHQWRLVIFDIPHAFKDARDAFRRKLRNLNFFPIQKSVFITPYPCENEIDFIASFFNIRKFIIIFNIKRFEGEEKLKHYFGI